MPDEFRGPSRNGAAAFRTTQWSVVVNAGSDDSKIALAALEELCRRYWYPLYAYMRRSGYSHDDAADSTQAFFARVVEKRSFARVEPGVARFRAFLLTALKHFLINEWQSANRIKRGGDKTIISFNEMADELYRLEPADDATPDKLYDKRWALSVLEIALARLRAEFVASERPAFFDALKPALTEKLERSYAEVAAEFELTESAVKTAVHRLRRRFREILFAEVAETLHDSNQVDEEVRYLVSALSV